MAYWSATLPLTKESVKQNVGKSGGVLRLMNCGRMGPSVFYVANCEDLGVSLNELLRGVSYNRGLAECLSHPGTQFRFFPTDNIEERSQVEEIELHKWHPPCNQR